MGASKRLRMPLEKQGLNFSEGSLGKGNMGPEKFKSKFDRDFKKDSPGKSTRKGTDGAVEEPVPVLDEPAVVAKVQSSTEFVEKVLTINRVAKVTKGGKKLSFSALVVVGDSRGRVGYSLGKAAEVATAIKKALGKAKKSMILVPMRGTTITHEILGECGAASVMLKPACDGTGVIAAGPVRAICDGAGIRNILT